STLEFGYDIRNLLVRVRASLPGAASPTTFVDGVDYDAKGQRASITFGNGARTTYDYDHDTFRLTRIVTVRGPAFPGDIQNLTYTHDPIGNITAVRDAAQQAVFFANRLVDPA